MHTISSLKKSALALMMLASICPSVKPMQVIWSFIKSDPKICVFLPTVSIAALACLKLYSDAAIKNDALKQSQHFGLGGEIGGWWDLDNPVELKRFAFKWITDVNPIIDEQGKTLLDQAISDSKVKIVTFLLDYGAKPTLNTANTKDSSLLVAIRAGCSEVVKLLMDKMTTADLELLNNENQTYLDEAKIFYVNNGEPLPRIPHQRGKTAFLITHNNAQEIYNTIYDEYNRRGLPVGEKAVRDK